MCEEEAYIVLEEQPSFQKPRPPKEQFGLKCLRLQLLEPGSKWGAPSFQLVLPRVEKQHAEENGWQASIRTIRWYG